MSRPLNGKLAIVTGASRGIGAAIATNLASKGANILINYTSPTSQTLATTLCTTLAQTHDVKTLAIQADVGTPEGTQSIIQAAKHLASQSPTSTQFQIDIIINNAGISINANIPNISEKDFTETYRINVQGPLLLVQAAYPYLPKDRSGRIVNISSVSSSTGFVGQSVYGGTKAALEAMTRTWARELAENCTVNAINPGPVEGPMYSANPKEVLEGIKPWIMHTPLMKAREGVDPPDVVAEARKEINGGGRPAYVDEIAGVVGMLVGAEAAWVTGQVVCANGGMLMLH
ncbi:hypothetical protein HDV00_012269 [Rhizophlyctis rosea]|nr:hypothetical protein HDV00_012269 [Rhizophlyctis rosea]